MTETLTYGYPPEAFGLRHWLRSLFATLPPAAAERRDAEARFHSLVRSHGDMIKKICFGYARTPEELDDLRQDTLVNIWQGLPKFRGDASMKTWVYRVTLNTCVSTLRSRRKELRGAPSDEIYDLIDDTDENIAALRELHEAIASLGPIDKAIVMQWLDEFSYDEIAATIGVSRANVATRLHRAKQRLRLRLGARG